MSKGIYHVSYHRNQFFVYNNTGSKASEGFSNWDDAQDERWELEGWGKRPRMKKA